MLRRKRERKKGPRALEQYCTKPLSLILRDRVWANEMPDYLPFVKKGSLIRPKIVPLTLSLWADRAAYSLSSQQRANGPCESYNTVLSMARHLRRRPPPTPFDPACDVALHTLYTSVPLDFLSHFQLQFYQPESVPRLPYSLSSTSHGRFHPPANHRVSLEDRMQEDAYEMGQIVLEFLHVWSLVGLWVSHKFRLRLHLARNINFGPQGSEKGTHDHAADYSNSCAVTLATEAAPWYQENAPGLIRTISAMFFPVGLIMIVLSGADLFTSNVMVRFFTESPGSGSP